jgi:hypothetical protein
MMSTTVQKPATTPIPVQLSEPEFEAFILPHLSMVGIEIRRAQL